MRKALFLIGLAACSDNATPEPDVARSSLERVTAPSSANVATLAADNRAFAFDLYRELAKQEGNLVFSPYSASTALAMTYAGARTTTESEMKQALHFKLEQAPLHEAFNAIDLALSSRAQADVKGTPFKLRVHNSIWVRRGLSLVPEFLDTLAINYGAPVYLADFAEDPEGARAKINGWVSEKTDLRCPELIPPTALNTRTTLVLTDTVYFEASWQTRFTDTADAAFTKLDGTSASVPMMHLNSELRAGEGTGYQAVALPYLNPELQLIAILPATGTFESFEAQLNDAVLAEVLASLQLQAVVLGFPKLELRTQLELRPVLQALGMNAAFDGADFSGIGDVGRITNVVQEATLSVDEQGTVAAAATAVVFGRKSATVNPRVLQFDRPFLYLIYDASTGTILFLGRVVAP